MTGENLIPLLGIMPDDPLVDDDDGPFISF